MNNHLVELVITCGSWQEAQRIADALLEKRLVDSIETFEIRPRHWWEGHYHGVQEVKLVVLTPADNLRNIKTLADKLHLTNTAPVLINSIN